MPEPQALTLFLAAALLLIVTPGPAVLFIVTQSSGTVYIGLGVSAAFAGSDRE